MAPARSRGQSRSAHQLAQRLEARLHDIALPAGDLRPVLAASLRQLHLREAGPQARFPDQRPARHAAILPSMGCKTPLRRICYIHAMRRIPREQLQLEAPRSEPPEARPRPESRPRHSTEGTHRPSAADLLETPGRIADPLASAPARFGAARDRRRVPHLAGRCATRLFATDDPCGGIPRAGRRVHLPR